MYTFRMENKKENIPRRRGSVVRKIRTALKYFVCFRRKVNKTVTPSERYEGIY